MEQMGTLYWTPSDPPVSIQMIYPGCFTPLQTETDDSLVDHGIPLPEPMEGEASTSTEQAYIDWYK